MFDLEARTAVITGAASGMGLAMATRFAEAGMRVVLADIEAGRLVEATDGLRSRGFDVLGVPTDVADAGAVTALADAAFSAYGTVDVLCNNAGVVKRARSWELTDDDWNWVLNVDLWSVIHGLRAFVPRMLTQPGGGHIVNTASMAALLPLPNLAAYSVAKAGVLALSESLQLEFDQLGAAMKVSVLCPGYIPTGITTSARNRPSALGDQAAAPDVPRTTADVVPIMTAADVAEQVLDAIRTDRFWILTHDDYRAVIMDRAARIGTEGRPFAAPVW